MDRREIIVGEYVKGPTVKDTEFCAGPQIEHAQRVDGRPSRVDERGRCHLVLGRGATADEAIAAAQRVLGLAERAVAERVEGLTARAEAIFSRMDRLRRRYDGLIGQVEALGRDGARVETRRRIDGPPDPADPALPAAVGRALSEAERLALVALDEALASVESPPDSARARGYAGRREVVRGFFRLWAWRLRCEREVLAARVLAGLPDRAQPIAELRLSKLLPRLRGALDVRRAGGHWTGPKADPIGPLLWLSVVAALGRSAADSVFGPSTWSGAWPVAPAMRGLADPVYPDAALGIILAGGLAGRTLSPADALPRAESVLARAEVGIVAALRVLSGALLRDPSATHQHAALAQDAVDRALAEAHAAAGEPAPLVRLLVEVTQEGAEPTQVRLQFSVACAGDGVVISERLAGLMSGRLGGAL